MEERMCTVQQGGLFHSAKVKYSPETEAFLKELIRESKLSIFQRKEVEKSVKNGEPLPLPPKKTSLSGKQKVIPLEKMAVRYILPRRRKLNAIKQSGAFERDTFVPSYEKANHETEKKKLQELMAFGRTLKSGKPRKNVWDDGDETNTIEENDKISEESVLKELQLDIEDKKKFLEKMNSFGRGEKYKDIIEQEIAGKYRIMDNIKEMFKELKKHDDADTINPPFEK